MTELEELITKLELISTVRSNSRLVRSTVGDAAYAINRLSVEKQERIDYWMRIVEKLENRAEAAERDRDIAQAQLLPINTAIFNAAIDEAITVALEERHNEEMERELRELKR